MSDAAEEERVASESRRNTGAQVLLGDLGGTNIRFSLYSVQELHGVRSAPTYVARYRTADFGHLSEALQRFAAEKPDNFGAIVACSLSVCGPVSSGKAICLHESMGADGWALEEVELAKVLGLPEGRVRMLNDFVAVGLAVGGAGLSSSPETLHTVHPGAGINNTEGTIAVLGPGTGLGSCFGTRQPQLEIYPSEGGESDFVARTDKEWALRTHLARSLDVDHVKVEHVVSGLGISRIYAFLRAGGQGGQGGAGGTSKRRRTSTTPADDRAAAIQAEVDAAVDPSAVVVAHGTLGSPNADPECVAAVDMFIDALGAEAANLALRFQAFGGVYIAGGVAAKLSDRLVITGRERLLAAYLGKGHSVDAYRDCPLYVLAVEGDDLAMAGAWEFAKSDKVGFRRIIA